MSNLMVTRSYAKILHKRAYSRLVDVDVAAERLGYDITSVRRICRIHREEVRSEKRGRRWFVCVPDLRKFVSAGGHRGPHGARKTVRQSGDPDLLSMADAAACTGYQEVSIRRIFKKAAHYQIRTAVIDGKQYISVNDIRRLIDTGVLEGPGRRK